MESRTRKVSLKEQKLNKKLLTVVSCNSLINYNYVYICFFFFFPILFHAAVFIRLKSLFSARFKLRVNSN